jgi:hypothetical protein
VRELETERDRLREALTQFSESWGKFHAALPDGGTKDSPRYDYYKMARAALATPEGQNELLVLQQSDVHHSDRPGILRAVLRRIAQAATQGNRGISETGYAGAAT